MLALIGLIAVVIASVLAVGWTLWQLMSLEIRDYNARQIVRDYLVRELEVSPGSWFAGHTLGQLGLRNEGVTVLGISRSDGTYVGEASGQTRVEGHDTLILYGTERALGALKYRRSGLAGDLAHRKAVMEQQQLALDRARREWQGNPAPMKREPSRLSAVPPKWRLPEAIAWRAVREMNVFSNK